MAKDICNVDKYTVGEQHVLLLCTKLLEPEDLLTLGQVASHRARARL